MRIKPLEIEFAGDEEDHGAHGLEAGVAPRLTLGRLEQSIEGLEEAIGLPSVRPRHNTLKLLTDHPSHPFHRDQLGAHDSRCTTA